MNAQPTTTLEQSTLTVMVRDREGESRPVSFDDVVQYHEGDSWFGCAAGFRAIQKATEILFADGMLDRRNLYIVSGHPGPGVRDAVDVLTDCVRLGRYRLLDENNTVGCNRDMRFEWWISNGRHTAHVSMSDDIVPDAFFELAERMTDGKARKDDRGQFRQMKSDLRDQLLSLSLDQAFSGERLQKPLSLGGLPDA